MKNRIFSLLVGIIVIVMASGCEHHYYTIHHEHSERYNRHHRDGDHDRDRDRDFDHRDRH